MISATRNKGALAIWAITPNGAALAAIIAKSIPGADLYLTDKLADTGNDVFKFSSLSGALSGKFKAYNGHIFIMSTGIVVRIITPFIINKTVDPAVVVIDEMGHHAVSLLSGHIGGANDLAIKVAGLIGADPVITTATDINRITAIDVIAKKKSLFIENPAAIKNVNMALLTGKEICLYDPSGFTGDTILNPILMTESDMGKNFKNIPGVFIDDIRVDLPSGILVLRPRSLFAGIGCNRNTSMEEIKFFLFETLNRFQLASGSLAGIATINIKKDESGLTDLAKILKLPIKFFNKEELSKVDNIKTPSAVVEKHVGVKSVCEAAAILAAGKGKLIVPKQSTRNVTVAIARTSFI